MEAMVMGHAEALRRAVGIGGDEPVVISDAEGVMQ